MVKVKFDVSNSDPADAKAGGGEQPKPGVYPAKISALIPGFAKGGDGKPDKGRPRLEVHIQLLKKNGKPDKYALIYDYISFSEASEWKLDQFLQCFELASDKKRKGEFDTDKIVGKTFNCRIKADAYDGEYRGKAAAYIPMEDAEEAEDEDEDEDEIEEIEEDEDLDDDEEDDLEDEEEEEDDEDEDGAYTEAGLKEMSLIQITKIAKDLGVVAKGKSKVIAGILEAQSAEDEEEEEAEESGGLEAEYTMEDCDEMTVTDLKEILTEHKLDIPARKTKKALIEALVASGLVENEEEPF